MSDDEPKNFRPATVKSTYVNDLSETDMPPPQREFMASIYDAIAPEGPVLDKLAALTSVLLTESVHWLQDAPTPTHAAIVRDLMRVTSERLAQYAQLQKETAVADAMAMGDNVKRN